MASETSRHSSPAPPSPATADGQDVARNGVLQ